MIASCNSLMAMGTGMKMALVTAAVAAMLALGPHAAAQSGALQCSGTEPFWTVKITAQEATLTTPDGGDVRLGAASVRHAVGVKPDQVRVYEIRRAGGEGATLVVTRNPQTCSDGMSDRRYPYDVVFIDRERVLQGCCRWMQ